MLKKIIGAIISIAVIGIIALLILFKISIGSVSNDDTKKDIFVEEGMSYMTISSMLKENNLINSELFYKIYIKLNNPQTLETGKYELSESMSLKEIINILSSGSNYNEDVITVTFNEGLNMRAIARIIEKNTNNKYEDVLKVLEDEKYIDELIEKYWFLTDEIKNSKIYYPLEGYLYPETYEFLSKDVSVKDIFEKMLDQTDKILTSIKDEKNDYTIHQLLTFASIVELEAGQKNDRNDVAGVFTNRLNISWETLGSDITAYYGAKMDDWSNGLGSAKSLCNGYNTRLESSCPINGLPVGPVSNPGIESIKATLNPTKTDAMFFAADCNRKTYLTKTNSEHEALIAKLKKEGNWCDK